MESQSFIRRIISNPIVQTLAVYVDGYVDEVTGNHSGEKHGFFIDRYEVTNKQYKEFVDQGGYSNPSFWKHEFIKDGKILTWDEAMAEFTDKSGRPGPATWQAGDYPEGQGDYPVSCISWYEATAYALYAGKDLPTVKHWGTGAGLSYFYISYHLNSGAFHTLKKKKSPEKHLNLWNLPEAEIFMRKNR